MKLIRVLAPLVALLLWAAPASAATSDVTWLNCRTSTGELTDIGPSGSPTVQWTLQPCTPPRSTDHVAVAIYYPGSQAQGFAQRILQQGSIGGQTLVTVQPAAAVACLLTSPTTRIHCRTIVFDALDAPALGQQVPVSSPAVTGPVTIIFDVGDIDPGGPTCPSCT